MSLTFGSFGIFLFVSFMLQIFNKVFSAKKIRSANAVEIVLLISTEGRKIDDSIEIVKIVVRFRLFRIFSYWSSTALVF